MTIRTAVLLLLLSPSALAGWQSAGNVDSTALSGNAVARLRAGSAVLTIRVITDDMVRIQFQSSPGDAPGRSWAVVKTGWPAPDAEMHDGPESLRITTPELSLTVGKKPLRLTFRDSAGRVIASDDSSLGMSWNGPEVRAWKTMPAGEQYYGFGEKAGEIRKRNAAMTMWNSDIPAYSGSIDPLYESIPFFYGIRDGKAYGIFFDNTYRSSFDMGKESRSRYSFGAEGGDLTYYFLYGPAPAKILARYTELVGRMPLPPAGRSGTSSAGGVTRRSHGSARSPGDSARETSPAT